MKQQFALVLAVGVLAGIGLAGCEDADENGDRPAVPASATAPAQALTWGACPAQAEAAEPRDKRQTCATLKVPLNYGEPGGATIEVAVSKLSAATKDKRHGVLLVNPGGPGTQGLDMPGSLAAALPASVLEQYDLIGFDPRGVGHSTPQSCKFTDPVLLSLFPYPAPDGSITANEAAGKATAQQCATAAGKDLQYFTTANTARDMDRIRTALGEAKISYWGQSYGTYLGTVYSSLFPDRTDRIVLEGAVDGTKIWQGELALQSKGMADRFPDIAAAVAGQNATLGLGRTASEVTTGYLALADKLDRKPVTLPGTPLALTGGFYRGVTYALLMRDKNFPVLAQFWKASADLAGNHATDTDKAVLQQVFAAGSPHTPGVPADNEASMFLAISCGDTTWPNSTEAYDTNVAADRKAYPLTAGMPANIFPCATWPNAPLDAPVAVTAQGHRNILILQNRRDNATPWEGAAGLRTALGNRAAFVGAENGGHYVYKAGSACVDQATDTFLTGGTLPDKDVTCTDVK